MQKTLFLSLFIIAGNLMAQTPCENGMAGIFPCNQVILQSHITMSEPNAKELNDIWGWTDSQTGKEYVLVGLTDGVTFVDIQHLHRRLPLVNLEKLILQRMNHCMGNLHGEISKCLKIMYLSLVTEIMIMECRYRPDQS